MSLKITILSGTNRPGSNTRKVVSQLVEQYEAIGQPVDIMDLAELPPEIFAPAAYADTPTSFLPFSQGILKSDGVHIVTPEYNGGVPGVLKYFIDMLEFPESFEHRPVAFTGLAMGMWGALRPVEQLQAIFGYRNAYLFPERVFMPGIGKLLDEQGKLKDAGIVTRLKSQAEGFVKFVTALRPEA